MGKLGKKNNVERGTFMAYACVTCYCYCSTCTNCTGSTATASWMCRMGLMGY